MPGVTLDAGAMIALERNDRSVVVLLARARETGARVTIPATALAQARLFPFGAAGRRGGARVRGVSGGWRSGR